MDINVYSLNLSENIADQVLKLAGWYAGRKVDISDLLLQSKKKNFITNDAAKNFWSEYYGIQSQWYFKCVDADGTAHIGGWDYSFDANVPAFYSYHFETPEDYQDELNQISKNERQNVIPICEAGFHDPGILWINDSGQIFWTLYFDDEKAYVFDSPFEYFQHEFKSLENKEKVLLSFDYEVYIGWTRKT